MRTVAHVQWMKHVYRWWGNKDRLIVRKKRMRRRSVRCCGGPKRVRLLACERERQRESESNALNKGWIEDEISRKIRDEQRSNRLSREKFRLSSSIHLPINYGDFESKLDGARSMYRHWDKRIEIDIKWRIEIRNSTKKNGGMKNETNKKERDEEDENRNWITRRRMRIATNVIRIYASIYM